jgi:hypothetical protein
MTQTRFLAIGLFVAATSLHSAAQQPGTGSPVTKFLPGTRGGVLSYIQGNALSSSNGRLVSTSVRLRDARLGRIVDTQVTDNSGSFAFKAIDPGSYIIEIIGEDRTVLAASQVVSVNYGQAVSAVVKLPFRVQPLAGLLGNSVPSATAVITQAAASGVLATTAAGEPASGIF